MALDATLRRSELLRRLRELRKATGKTQSQVGAFLGCKQGKINKIESGETMVKPEDLRRLLHLYEATPEEKEELWELTTMAIVAVPGRQPLSKEFVEQLQLEAEALEILILHSERVPKLLQSERYLLTQYQEARDYSKPVTLLLERRERAKLFERSQPPRYRAILAESALHRMPGGRTATKVIDQAEYLLDVGRQYEHVEIQILTYEARIPYLDPDFTVLRFGDESKDVAYVEHAAKEDILRAAQDVDQRITYWEQVHQAALSVGDSREFLRHVIAQARSC